MDKEFEKWLELHGNSIKDLSPEQIAYWAWCDGARAMQAAQQPLALDDAHVCGWCKGKQNLVWSCPVCDVG